MILFKEGSHAEGCEGLAVSAVFGIDDGGSGGAEIQKLWKEIQHQLHLLSSHYKTGKSKVLATSTRLLSFKIKTFHKHIDLIDHFQLGEIVNIDADRLHHFRNLIIRGIEEYRAE